MNRQKTISILRTLASSLSAAAASPEEVLDAAEKPVKEAMRLVARALSHREMDQYEKADNHAEKAIAPVERAMVLLQPLALTGPAPKGKTQSPNLDSLKSLNFALSRLKDTLTLIDRARGYAKRERLDWVSETVDKIMGTQLNVALAYLVELRDEELFRHEKYIADTENRGKATASTISAASKPPRFQGHQ